MNKEMYLTEHLVLPSEATLSQTSELDGVRKLSIHLRRSIAAEHCGGALRRSIAAEGSAERSAEVSVEGDAGTGGGYFFSLKEFSMLEISSRKALSTLRRCSIVLQEWITVEWSRPPISWPMREAGILVCF